MVIRTNLSAFKSQPNRQETPAPANAAAQSQSRTSRLGGAANEAGGPPARRDARATSSAPAANLPVNARPGGLFGRRSALLPANDSRPLAAAAGDQGAANVLARPNAQEHSSPLLEGMVVAAVQNALTVVDLNGFTRALGQVPLPGALASPATLPLLADLCAQPILQLMNRISVLPARDRAQAQSAIAAKVNEMAPSLRSPALAAVARIAQVRDPLASAQAGENLALISVFHGLQTFEQVEPLLEIIFERHALPAVLAGDSPRDVAERFGLHTHENLERLEQTAALPDGVIGRAMLSGANANDIASRYGFQTELGIGQLQATAYIGLRDSSELKEATNVAAVAARHGIVEPTILGELEAAACEGRAGRAAQVPGSNVQRVAAAHGFVTPKGIETLEMSILESRVGPELLKLEKIRTVAAKVGITSPNTLLTMEYFAINHLPQTLGETFHWGTPASVAAQVGIESATGLQTLESVMSQAKFEDLSSIFRITE